MDKEDVIGSSCCGSAVKNLTSIHEDASLIPGLPQQVKDPALPQAAAQVSDMALFWCCCGCAIGWQLQLRFDPQAGNFPDTKGMALKRKKKKRRCNTHTHTQTHTQKHLHDGILFSHEKRNCCHLQKQRWSLRTLC